MAAVREVAHEVGDTSSQIVVGVDGSQESFAALHWAAREALLSNSEVHAVFGSAGAKIGGGRSESELHDEILSKLGDWDDLHDAEGNVSPVPLTVTAVESSGTDALLNIGGHAQQIVVGRRSMGQVMRWFAGSLSASLVEQATVPVTVVRISDVDEQNALNQLTHDLSAGKHPTGGERAAVCDRRWRGRLRQREGRPAVRAA